MSYRKLHKRWSRESSKGAFKSLWSRYIFCNKHLKTLIKAIIRGYYDSVMHYWYLFVRVYGLNKHYWTRPILISLPALPFSDLQHLSFLQCLSRLLNISCASFTLMYDLQYFSIITPFRAWVLCFSKTFCSNRC